MHLITHLFFITKCGDIAASYGVCASKLLNSGRAWRSRAQTRNGPSSRWANVWPKIQLSDRWWSFCLPWTESSLSRSPLFLRCGREVEKNWTVDLFSFLLISFSVAVCVSSSCACLSLDCSLRYCPLQFLPLSCFFACPFMSSNILSECVSLFFAGREDGRRGKRSSFR